MLRRPRSARSSASISASLPCCFLSAMLWRGGGNALMELRRSPCVKQCCWRSAERSHNSERECVAGCGWLWLWMDWRVLCVCAANWRFFGARKKTKEEQKSILTPQHVRHDRRNCTTHSHVSFLFQFVADVCLSLHSFNSALSPLALSPLSPPAPPLQNFQRKCPRLFL